MSTRERLILSAVEPDRPGLVAELTGYIAERGCNVEDSRVAVLGSHAGLMFLVSGTPRQLDAIDADLSRLERGTGLRVVSRRMTPSEHAPIHADVPPTYVVNASAMDHEGIIHAITDVVRGHGGNILELETSTESAPMTGSPLFALRMTITLAERHGSAARLRAALDVLARESAMDLAMTDTADERFSPAPGFGG